MTTDTAAMGAETLLERLPRGQGWIRIALGADPRRILSATLGQGVSMIGFGLLVGGVLSIWAARALSSLLVATDHLDVVSVGVPAVVLMVAGALAVLPTARRAARTDPLIVLRSE